MKNGFGRLSGAGLCVVLLVAGAQAARAQQAGSRTQGPASGPVITLPPGHGETTVEQQGEARAPRAASAVAPAARPTKWEYCVIDYVGTQGGGMMSQVTGFANVRYFRGGRERVEGASQEEALAAAMTKLGEEGWEMVAVSDGFSVSDGSGSSTARYFFKRPL